MALFPLSTSTNTLDNHRGKGAPSHFGGFVDKTSLSVPKEEGVVLIEFTMLGDVSTGFHLLLLALETEY